MRAMFFLLMVLCTSCTKNEDKNSDLDISLDYITGVWKQSEPLIITSTNLDTGEKFEQAYDETYTFDINNRFEISGALYYKIGTEGSYTFDSVNNTIEFSCEGSFYDINGVLVQFEKEPQLWKWDIIDLRNDTMVVDKYAFNKELKQYYENPGFQLKYVKQ